MVKMYIQLHIHYIYITIYLESRDSIQMWETQGCGAGIGMFTGRTFTTGSGAKSQPAIFQWVRKPSAFGSFTAKTTARRFKFSEAQAQMQPSAFPGQEEDAAKGHQVSPNYKAR